MKYFNLVQHSTCPRSPTDVHRCQVFWDWDHPIPPHASTQERSRCTSGPREDSVAKMACDEWSMTMIFCVWYDVKRSMSSEPLLCRNILWMLNRILSFWYFWYLLMPWSSPSFRHIMKYTIYILDICHIYTYIPYSSVFNQVDSVRAWDALAFQQNNIWCSFCERGDLSSWCICRIYKSQPATCSTLASSSCVMISPTAWLQSCRIFTQWRTFTLRPSVFSCWAFWPWSFNRNHLQVNIPTACKAPLWIPLVEEQSMLDYYV